VSVGVTLNRLEEWPLLAGESRLLTEAARSAVREVGASARGELSITFVLSSEIHALNREYLDRDRPTDVIAFDLGTDDDVLGDVYIAPDVAADQAAALGIGLLEEVSRLVIHGVLHVFGHEHPEDETRADSDMFQLQEELLGRLRQG